MEQAGKIEAFLDEEGFDWNRGINTAAGLLLRKAMPVIAANSSKLYIIGTLAASQNFSYLALMSRSRQLAAIMFTDIQGYTALMQQNEQQAIQARDKHRRIFNSTTEKHKGKVLQYYGDGTLSIFDSAIDAVQCAIEMQLGFQENPAIPVRIGIHTGDIAFSEEDIIGDSVNVASRIESLAVPGSVFISEKVYDEIKNQESIKATRLKAFKLKNIEKPIEVYAISNEGLVVPNPEDITGKTEGSPAPAPEKPDSSGFPEGGMPILATKLFIPPPRPNAVRRPRLAERLNAGLHGKLALISAPAGFGKTTLASEWAAGSKWPVAWLSLEEGDSEPMRFLAYLVAALKAIAEDFGDGVLGMLQSPQPPPTESILTALLNEIAAIPGHFVLVLDDYHLVDSKAVDDALAFLLGHLPPQMHLAITTREDPNLPLARLRVRGQLAELRAADLRFTPSEAAGFLNQAMGLNLSEADVAALETRTEGWIAGLQMAALSLQGRADTAGFIEAFAGSHRFVLDYLAEEVLQQQPEGVRSFLLQTSILNKLCGPLCDAVTNQEGSKGILDTLERGNLFVVPLDGQRRWYRYHHLFADVLRARSMEELPDQLPILHQRASGWFERHGSPADAIRHALAGRDFERAAGIIERAWPAMDEHFQTATWLNWAKGLPEELVRNRPVLLVGIAWALLSAGKLEAGEARLREAERLLGSGMNKREPGGASTAGMVVVDEEQFRFLPSSIATARAYHAQALGDLPGAVKHARQALGFLPEEDHLRRGPAAALLGLAHWASGDLAAAHRDIADAMANFRMAGNLLFALSGTYGLADICIAQGRLREAVSTYQRSLQLVAEQGEPALLGTADLYLGLGGLHLERGDLDAAIQHLLKSEALGEQLALPDWPYRLRLVKARVAEARGGLVAALGLLDEAERLYYRSPVPDARPIAALKARLWARQGRLAEALDWARERGLSVEDELSYLREFEHITLARIRIAQYKTNRADHFIREAAELLDRLLKAAEEGGRMGVGIEILALQALAHEAQGNFPLALEPLQRALALAEPEGYVRIFADEGPPMARLLTEAAAQGILPGYAGRLLSALGVEGREAKEQPYLSRPRNPSAQPLVEPLSERELEILQLIARGLSNREISERLFLALSTVKGHNRNIFGKLEVQRRTEAVARARELGLL